MNIGFFLWLIYVSYLNSLINSNCKDKAGNVIKLVDALKAFKDKLANWKKKIKIKNCAMLEKLDVLFDSKKKKMSEKMEKYIFKKL